MINVNTIYIFLPLSQPLIHDGLQVQKHFMRYYFKNFTLEKKKIYQKMVQQMYDNIKQEEVHL